ncbi:hypothetical protein ABBQ32_007367 [Trebouxia sp. C0010 RCD-2024]
MAKRRKAPRKVPVSDSEDDAATEVHEPARRWQADAEAREPKNEAQSKAQTLIDDLEVAVQDKISALLRMADDAAASMNNELRVQLVKIPKQIRLMKLSEFQDKHEGDLTGPALEEIKQRQQALKAQLTVPPATGSRSGAPGTITRTTRKRAAPAVQPDDAAPPPPARRSARGRPGRPPRPAPPSLPTVAEDEEEQEAEADSNGEPGQSQAQPAGGGDVRQRVLNTPMPGGGSMQTPMPPGWKNAEFGGACATVVRKAGRGAKTKAGSAIVITCADGEQVAVDMLGGLSSVPENRRQEVQQQLAQLKSLAETALR